MGDRDRGRARSGGDRRAGGLGRENLELAQAWPVELAESRSPAAPQSKPSMIHGTWIRRPHQRRLDVGVAVSFRMPEARIPWDQPPQ